MLLVALAVGAVVAGAVWMKKRSSGASAAAPAAEAGAPASASAAPGHRLSKFIEIAGFRLSEDTKKRAQVKLIVINHSAAELGDLELSVTLKTPEGKVVGTSEVKVPSVGPLASADVSAPLKTTERAYELPDWQFIRADFQITSP